MTPVVILATTNTPLLIKVILNLRIFYKSIFEDDATLQRLAIINLDFCTAPDYKPRIMKLFETIGDKRTLHISWQVSHVLIKM